MTKAHLSGLREDEEQPLHPLNRVSDDDLNDRAWWENVVKALNTGSPDDGKWLLAGWTYRNSALLYLSTGPHHQSVELSGDLAKVILLLDDRCEECGEEPCLCAAYPRRGKHGK